MPLAQMIGYMSLDALTASISAGLKSVYPNEPVYSKVFNSPFDETAEQAESLCLVDLGNAFGEPLDAYWAANGNSLKGYASRKKADYRNDPIVKQFLTKDSQPLQTVVKTPIIIYQGGADKVVLPQATDALVAQARALTTKIDYRTDPSWTHAGVYTVNVENGQLLEDIKTLLGK